MSTAFPDIFLYNISLAYIDLLDLTNLGFFSPRLMFAVFHMMRAAVVV